MCVCGCVWKNILSRLHFWLPLHTYTQIVSCWCLDAATLTVLMLMMRYWKNGERYFSVSEGAACQFLEDLSNEFGWNFYKHLQGFDFLLKNTFKNDEFVIFFLFIYTNSMKFLPLIKSLPFFDTNTVKRQTAAYQTKMLIHQSLTYSCTYKTCRNRTDSKHSRMSCQIPFLNEEKYPFV